jgi:hypothetical protein
MVLTTSFLTEVAKAINDEGSVTLPSHLAFGETTIVASPSVTSVTDEVGTRPTASSTRNGTTVTYNGIRSGTDVVDTVNGDTLAASHLMTASSGGSVQAVQSLPNIRHTTSFDVEMQFEVSVTQR